MHLYKVTANGFTSIDVLKTSYVVAPDYTAAGAVVLDFFNEVRYGSDSDRVIKTIEHVADGVAEYTHPYRVVFSGHSPKDFEHVYAAVPASRPKLPKLFLPALRVMKPPLHLFFIRTRGLRESHPHSTSYVVAADPAVAANIVQETYDLPVWHVEFVADGVVKYPHIPKLLWHVYCSIESENT